MALIRNITSSWSDAVTLSTDEVWQARKGAVLLSTQASPGAQDGIGLAAGKALRFASGTQLRYRKDGAGEAMIAREAVGGGLMAAIGTVPPLLFLVAGQSNAIGRAAFDAGDLHPANTVQWTSAGGERAATVPLQHAGAQAGEMGLDLSFAAAVRAAHPEAKIVFIPVAVAETGFADNRWNPGDDLFNAAVAEANAAIAQYDVGGLSGILWQQGARDAATPADAGLYQARLEAMVLALRAAITGSNDTPFLVGEIGAFLDPGTYPGRDAVIAAQNGFAANITRAATVTTGDLTAFDGVHFDATSLRTLGTRYHATLIVAEAHTPAPVISGVPGISGVIGVGNTVTAIPADVRPKPSVTSWRWELDGVPIAGATGASYTIQPGDAHGALTLRQIETGIGGTHAVTSLTGAVGAGIATPPGQVQGLAVMPGDGLNDLAWSVPAQGSAAITDYLVEVSVDGAPYASLADGVSTATSFTHAGLSNGTAYTYRVSAVNTAGTGAASAPRTGTPLPALAAPENRIAPAIGGTFETGQTLSVTEGAWIGNPAFTLAYQWTRDGVDIAGATSSTYTITGADAGSVVGCTVTASNSEGLGSVNASGAEMVSSEQTFNVASLFAGGEPGGWWKPSPETCFQDIAGTIPCEVGDPVGLLIDTRMTNDYAVSDAELVDTLIVGAIDISGYQETEQSGAVEVGRWYRFELTISDYVSGELQVGTGPQNIAGNRAIASGTTSDGTYTTTFQATDTSIQYRGRASFKGTITLSVREVTPALAGDGVNTVGTMADMSVTQTGTWTDVGSGTFTFEDTIGSQVRPGMAVDSFTAIAGDLCILTIDVLSISGATHLRLDRAGIDDALVPVGPSTVVFAYSGSSSPRIRLESLGTAIGDGFTLNSFTVQRAVGSPLFQDVSADRPTLAKVGGTGSGRYALDYNGVNYSIKSVPIDLTSTSAVSVFAGIKKASETDPGVVLEFSDGVSDNHGSFHIVANNTSGAIDWEFSARGDGTPQSAQTDDAQPQSVVLAGLADLSAPSNKLRIDGVDVAERSSSMGAGNFGRYPVHIGARGAALLPFEGKIGDVILRGAHSSVAEIEGAEAYIARTFGGE